MITYIIKKILLGERKRGEKAFVQSGVTTVIESKDWNPNSISAYNKWCAKFKLSTLY
jgi:hypothetical protein